MKVLFRADASIQTGSGHIMRCLTLATALRAHADCHFICREESGHLAEVIRQQGFSVSLLNAAAPLQQQADALASLAALNTDYDLLIIDHYQLAAPYSHMMRRRCRYIMVIDDLANREHDCDILLDQNLLPDSETRYHGLLPVHCIPLTGPAYALLREEFYHSCPIQREAERILVFFGGGDADNLTSLTLQALTQLNFPGLKADIVIGAANPARQQIEALCAALPGTELHIQCNYMARLMHQAALMIGAGGSTHWERCYSGLPALVVTIADNQLASTRYLAELGACVWLGNSTDISAGQLAAQIAYYLTQPAKLKAMAQQAKQLIPADADTHRVVTTLLSQCRN
ncbi:UDP-2,4-diacetamido-2,4,6-trideoxy-beta-L-altropyranose hydrolase [Chromatiaceae bacterium AAb-1]|nr:UDP-2,4-diacetamido-2,4,6-trideoxy-beta-L-altropyranose hydrolase [Chromatiaceae bacterium AAb-1]